MSKIYSFNRGNLVLNIQRIAIIGNTASGKSCLSVKLSKELKIPVFHLDKYLWKPGWVRVPEDEFTASHNGLISKDFWIIDTLEVPVNKKATFRAGLQP